MPKNKIEEPVFVIGLGNPGKSYEKTPHSLGFLALDEFACLHDFPAFEMKTGGFLETEKKIDGKNVILVKPQTLMNNSGREVAKLFQKKKIAKKKSYPLLWVINDDLDLSLGKIKIAKNRGAAGHKGVQSIIDRLGTKNFIRFRLGIKKPEVNKKIPAENYVLKKFSKSDENTVKEILAKAAKAIKTSLEESIEKAMTEFNR